MRNFFYYIVLCSFSISVQAEQIFNWTNNNIQFLTGGGFELGTSYRNTVTFEHADGWKYGENYLFIDAIERDDVGIEVYGEWYPRLQLGKLMNKSDYSDTLNRLSIVGGINAGNQPRQDKFKAFLLGVGVNVPIPAFDFFQIDFMAYKSDDVNTTGIQITPAWSMPFQISNLKFKFRGFLDWISADATGGEDYILTQPQLLMDVGDLFGNSDQVYLGVEYWYWHNKFGINGVTEHAAQAMLLYDF